MQAKERCKNCYGYFSSGGRFAPFSDNVEYFCQKEDSLVIRNGTDNYYKENCISQFPSQSAKSEEYGWMPFENYTNAASKDECSNQTELNGYYSWSETLKKKNCGIMNGIVYEKSFCKLSGSDFIAYSREQEYKEKDCKPVSGSSFILLRFLP